MVGVVTVVSNPSLLVVEGWTSHGSGHGSEKECRGKVGEEEHVLNTCRASDGAQNSGDYITRGMPSISRFFVPPLSGIDSRVLSLLLAAMAPPKAKDEVRHSASPDIESLVYNDEHEVRIC